MSKITSQKIPVSLMFFYLALIGIIYGSSGKIHPWKLFVTYHLSFKIVFASEPATSISLIWSFWLSSILVGSYGSNIELNLAMLWRIYRRNYISFIWLWWGKEKLNEEYEFEEFTLELDFTNSIKIPKDSVWKAAFWRYFPLLRILTTVFSLISSNSSLLVSKSIKIGTP